MTRKHLGAFVVLVLLGAASPTLASPVVILPPTTYSGNVCGSSAYLGSCTPVTDSGLTTDHNSRTLSFGASSVTEQVANSSVVISTNPSPSMDVTLNLVQGVSSTFQDFVTGGAVFSNIFGGADVGMTYGMVITGPSGYAPVVLNTNITASIALSGSASFSTLDSFAQLSVGVPGGVGITTDGLYFPGSSFQAYPGPVGIVADQPVPNAFTFLPSSETAKVSDGNVYLMPTNTLIDISLFMSLEFGLLPQDMSNLLAFVGIDPTFSIDPSDPNAAQYSFAFSPGIGNSPATTPLPTTWTMLIGGFVCLGFLARRKTNKASGALLAA
jgi:hypothetical protein